MNGGKIYEHFTDGLEAKSPRLYKEGWYSKNDFL